MWGAGCIMAEMWTRTPIMQGNTEQHQLTLIAQLCGTINPDVWPGVENLDLYNKMELPKGSKRRVKERLKPYVKDPYACDLVDKLLWLDPSKRIDSDAALNHDFFWTDPMPCKQDSIFCVQQKPFKNVCFLALQAASKRCCRITSSLCSSILHPGEEAGAEVGEEAVGPTWAGPRPKLRLSTTKAKWADIKMVTKIWFTRGLL